MNYIIEKVSMAFTLSENNQFETISTGMKYFCYEKCNRAANKSGLTRLLGLPLGIACSAVDILKRIGLIAENIFKGLINIIGSPCNSQASFCQGLSQIFLHAPKNLVVLTTVALTSPLFIFYDTFRVLVAPEKYTRYCMNKYPCFNTQEKLNLTRTQTRLQQLNPKEIEPKAKPIKVEVTPVEIPSGRSPVSPLQQQDQQNQTETNIKVTPEKDLDSLLEAAGSGDVHSMCEIAVHYSGLEGEVSKKTGFEWAQKGAQTRDQRSMELLANLYLNGRGVNQSNVEAFYWFEQVESENPRKIHSEVEKLMEKEPDLKAYREAMQSVRLCQSLDFRPFMAKDLAVMFQKGKGAPQNDKEAFKYFLLAAQKGDPKAMYEASRCYTAGKGVERNLKDAFSWMQRATEHFSGIPRGFLPLAEMYLKGQGTEKSAENAYNWVKRANDNDMKESFRIAGLMSAQGIGCPQNTILAIRKFRIAYTHEGKDSRSANFAYALLIRHRNAPQEVGYLNMIDEAKRLSSSAQEDVQAVNSFISCLKGIQECKKEGKPYDEFIFPVFE